MEQPLSKEDKNKIEAGIRDRYAKVAETAEGQFNYPTGRPGLELLNYDPLLIGQLPERVSASYCGVGNPFSLGPISKGEAVLDIGCGAGVDVIIAAMIVGPAGKSVGVDIVDEMLHRAEANRNLMNLDNIALHKASGEDLPFDSASFDVVISNGVINLIPEKHATLKEAFRVLKPAGRLMIADQILVGELPAKLEDRIASWFH